MNRITAILCLFIAPWAAFGQNPSGRWPQQNGPAGCMHPPPIVNYDRIGDGAPRRTDFGASGPILTPLHAVPDIVGHRVGRWQPQHPDIDLYHGCWRPDGQFFRFDMAVAGLVNPPGLFALSGIVYEPFLFGPNPVFGFVEFDMDANINTGGDIETPQSGFLGNVARFGSLPMDPGLADRAARRGDEIDADLLMPPFVERSGEEFHLALFGDLAEGIVHVQGGGDPLFEPGDVWLVRGRFLHRAHGYERFSSANGDGSYAPRVDLRFEYIAAADVTQITIVYPLTNLGAAQQLSAPVEPPDGLDANQNSVIEALLDLAGSVQALPPAHPLRSDPAFPLIAEWEFQPPAESLAVDNWRLNAIVGMAYVREDPLGAVFVWTDAIGVGRPGDFNGDRSVTLDDVALFDAFLAASDGQLLIDDDGLVDGRVTIPLFGPNFDVRDLNYDGVIDNFDRQRIVVQGDLDADLDIDEDDLLLFTTALANPAVLPGTGCEPIPPAGACCIGTPGTAGVCVELSASACQLEGGFYFGDGVSCNSPAIPCLGPTPTACCLPNATCIEAPPEMCSGLGGVALPPSVPCFQAPCDQILTSGACCVPHPGSQPDTCFVGYEGQCSAQGGVYHGDNTTCDDPAVPCHALPPPEILTAVLLGENADPLAEGLSDVNGDGRVDGEDIQPYMQRLIAGGPSSVSGGACCFASGGASPGQCVTMLASPCEAEGGSFQGDGSSCDDAKLPCVGPPEFGACCLPDGACDALPFDQCAALGGHHGARGSTCEDIAQQSLMLRSDFDGNGLLDGRDIQGFVELLLTQ